MRERIEQIVQAPDLPGTTTTLHLWQHRPPMPRTAETERLVALVTEAGQEIDRKIEATQTMGGSDASFVAGQGIPALCGLGPVGGAVMTADEYVELSTLPERGALLAALAHKLSQSRRSGSGR
jgi:glutamate carboxypeptidase